MEPNELTAPSQLMKFIVGKWISKPIYVVAKLGIADILADGARDIDELARMTGTRAPLLYRIMRALAGVGIFCEREKNRFELTEMAGYLKTGAMRSIALMFNADWNDRAWARLLDSLKTGKTAFELAHGMPVFEWLEKNPRAADLLSEANAVKAAVSHRAIIDAYEFENIRSLVDIGGGYGSLMAEILAANPLMKGIVADIPSVIEGAKKTISERGIEDRCEAMACDFFKEIPPGRDAYILSHVLHDWPDDACKTILRNCHQAMDPESRLLVVEMVVPAGNEPSVAKFLDLEMLVITGGRERTESEFQELLESSGLRLSRIIPTKESVCVIEGVRD